MTAELIHSRHEPSTEFSLPGLAGRLPMLIEKARRHPPLKGVALQRLYGELVNSLKFDASGRITDSVAVTTAEPGSAHARTAATMLDWGSCSHYCTGHDEPELPPEIAILHSHTHTLVATVSVGHTSIVLGTLQAVIGPTVPALMLFGPASDDSGSPGMVGELRRFSVSPLLEVPTHDYVLGVVLRDYRSQIYRGLYTRSLEIFRTAGVETIYGIATPEIYRFFTRSGMPMRRLGGMKLIDSAELRQLQYRFARYWRPQAPKDQQPAMYQILCSPEDFVSRPHFTER
jgi:hypothetical protein